MFVVFDLDGTLADISHRMHYIQGRPKDYDAFYAACGGDSPCAPVLAALAAHMAAGHRTEIWTGRRESAREETIAWLARHGARGAVLARMRPAGDHSPGVDLKRAWIAQARAEGGLPALVYEDRSDHAAMWRTQGIACCLVSFPADY